MKMTRAVFMGSLLGLTSGCAAQEAPPVSLRVNVVNDSIDIYLVNTDPRGRAVSISADLLTVGVAAGFKFYGDDGKCVTCERSGGKSAADPAPVRARNWQPSRIVPNESVGRSLPIEVVSDIYDLEKGCYGFFVEVEGDVLVDKEEVRLKLVSNSGVVCEE